MYLWKYCSREANGFFTGIHNKGKGVFHENENETGKEPKKEKRLTCEAS